jgi:hypothetical protein
MKFSISNSIAIPIAVFIFSAGTARASFVYNVLQVGSNVVTTGIGTIDTAALTSLGSGETTCGYVIPSEGVLVGGPIAFLSDQAYSGISGPSAFGTGGAALPLEVATSGGGDLFGTSGGNHLYTPPGYQSEAPLSNTDTYNNTTISLLGFTPGTYVYTWGSGPTADLLTINIGVVPEPASAALIAAPVAIAALRRRRRQLV